VPLPDAPALERLEDVAVLQRPARAKKMLVIVNPRATTMSERLKHLVAYALQGRYHVEMIETERKGHAIELTAAAARDRYDVVVAFGGDGTVNEAANGLAGSSTILTCLPGGSNNVFAKMLGIPDDVVDATEHLLHLADEWRPRRADLGRVNGRLFTFAAGMGLDASVVERVDRHPHLKSRFGVWYYTQSAIATFLRRYVVHPPRLAVDVGGRRIEGVSAFFQNAEPYTYFKRRPVNLVGGAALDSGDLAGAVLTRATPIDIPTVLFRALSPAPIPKHRAVAAFAGARAITVRSLDGRPVPWQVDGDHVGDDTEIEVGVQAGALGIVG
jgi:diacylglycerol kinase family enzyme